MRWRQRNLTTRSRKLETMYEVVVEWFQCPRRPPCRDEGRTHGPRRGNLGVKPLRLNQSHGQTPCRQRRGRSFGVGLPETIPERIEVHLCTALIFGRILIGQWCALRGGKAADVGVRGETIQHERSSIALRRVVSSRRELADERSTGIEGYGLR